MVESFGVGSLTPDYVPTVKNPTGGLSRKKTRKKEERKRPLPEVLPISSLVELAGQLTNDEYRAIFAFCYLSGSRVTEALLMEQRDISMLNPLDRGDVLVAWVYTEKNPDHPRRQCPLRLISYLDRMDNREREAELKLYNWVLDYWYKAPDGLLWKKSRKTIWHFFKKLKKDVRATTKDGETEIFFGIHPHYLRHCRATHLSPFLSDKEMRDFFGWKSAKMVDVYANTKGTDILLKFQK